MSSLKQIEANRHNAQKSTGPRSTEGKAASSRNALKSGIDSRSQLLPGEQPEALERLTSEYYDRFHPTTPEARVLVDILISNEWLLRRFRLIEVQLIKHEMASAKSYLDRKNPIGDGYRRCERSMERLQRRINAVERSYHRALKELQALPKEIGFVPQPEPELQPASPPQPQEQQEPLATPAAVPPVEIPSLPIPVAPIHELARESAPNESRRPDVSQ